MLRERERTLMREKIYFMLDGEMFRLMLSVMKI